MKQYVHGVKLTLHHSSPGNRRNYLTLKRAISTLFFAGLLASHSYAQAPLPVARPELVVQTGHTAPILALAASPDGRWLASGSVDSTVRLWDVDSGRELRSLTGHTNAVNALAFSPDGRILASGSYNGDIRLWNVATGRQLRTIEAHDNPVWSLAFSTDGRSLASASVTEAKVWDVATGAELSNLISGRNVISPNAFTSGAKIFAARDKDGRISLRDVATGRKVRDLSSGLVTSMCFSPDGRLLAANGKEIVVWDVASGHQVRTISGHTNFGSRIVFSGDSQNLISSTTDNTIAIWNIETGQEIRTFKSNAGQVSALVSDATGKWIASANAMSISISNPQNGAVLRVLTGQAQSPLASIFTPDGRQILNGMPSGAIASWDLTAARPGRAMNGHSGSVSALRISPDGTLLASAGWDHTIRLWNLASRQLLRVLRGHTANVWTIAFSPDGRTLASGSMDMTVRLWDVATGRELRSIDFTGFGPSLIKGSNDQIAAVAFSPDGKLLACTDQRATIKLFDPATGQELSTYQGHTENAEALAFSPDGKILASGSYDHTIRLWDVASGQAIRTMIAHDAEVTALTFSRDGRRLVSASRDHQIKIWDVASGTVLETLSGHSGDVRSVNFSPNGDWLVSHSGDGTTRLWDYSTGELKASLILMNDQRDWLVVAPDGLFDGSPAAWPQIFWRFNNNTADVAPVESFFSDFYHPSLLADILAGKNPKAKTDIAALDRRLPAIQLALITPPDQDGAVASRSIRIRIQVDQAPADKDHAAGSGARDLRLFRNGSLVKLWHGDVLNGSGHSVLDAEIPIVAGENHFSAYVFNHDNIKSPDANLSVTGAGSLQRKGTAYVLAVGINQYDGSGWNLRYAASDAQDFAAEVGKALQQSGKFKAVKTIALLNSDATKDNLTSALERLAAGNNSILEGRGFLDQFVPAEPEDAVFVYYAGHGTASGSHFYLIPHDLGTSKRPDQLDEHAVDAILKHSVSDLELENLFERIDAGELVLIVDACRSGEALHADDPRQGPMNSTGLAQLAYDKGMYILTASQGYQAALELSSFEHGLLTYALLDQGLRAGLADTDPKDGQITLRKWLDFAADEVPRLQIDAMRDANRRGLSFAVVDGEQNTKLEDRSLQQPRVFYRREPEAQPFVIKSLPSDKATLR